MLEELQGGRIQSLHKRGRWVMGTKISYIGGELSRTKHTEPLCSLRWQGSCLRDLYDAHFSSHAQPMHVESLDSKGAALRNKLDNEDAHKDQGDAQKGQKCSRNVPAKYVYETRISFKNRSTFRIKLWMLQPKFWVLHRTQLKRRPPPCPAACGAGIRVC